MTVRTVPILATVTNNEQAIVERAARDLAAALNEAPGQTSGGSWTCPCTFAPGLDSLAGTTAGSIVVTSLQLALAEVERPWPEVERELHDSYKALCEAGAPVMIFTLLRHVDAAGDAARAARIRRRIRRLNLLATELSRQYGALVIDLDRVLADVGARRLATDFRLGGPLVAELAGRTAALCIVTTALDDFASVEVQNAARARLEQAAPATGLLSEEMMTDVLSIGKGRRAQRASTITDEVPENHVVWLARQVLKGRVGVPEALGKLAGAVRRRGARESAGLLISGVSRLIRTPEAGRRG